MSGKTPRPIRRGRLVVVDLLAWVAMGMATGCATTRDDSSSIHPWNDEEYQTPTVRLTGLESPETRTGAQKRTKDLTVVTAISGGGHRAANFGLGALLGLERIRHKSTNALMEIDSFSTVSGGGLAAAAFITSLHDYQRFGARGNGGASYDPTGYSLAASVPGEREEGDDHADPPSGAALEKSRTDPSLRRHLRRNYESELGTGFFSSRTWFNHLDRGDFLEKVFDDYVLGYEWRKSKLESDAGATDPFGDDPSFCLSDVFVRETDARPQLVPHWFCNATVYENGAIFPWCPEMLALYEITGYTHRLEHEPPKKKRGDPLTDAHYSVALTSSGNFPVAIPTTTLTSSLDEANPFLHLLDGGVADNLGITTALTLLSSVSNGGSNGGDDRRVLVVIDVFPGTFAPYSSVEGSPDALTTIERLTSVGLASWRNRHRRLIKRFVAGENTDGVPRVVFISFDELDDAKFEHLERYEFCRHDRKRLQRQLKLPDDADPFAFARAVQTRYTASEVAQRFLIAAGRYVVRKQESWIRECFWGAAK